MILPTVASREVLPVPTSVMHVMGNLGFEPIVEGGREEGVLVVSSLERVALFLWGRRPLTLSEISRLRRIMRRIQARRGVLYLPIGLTLASSVKLLAALSSIVVVGGEAEMP